MAVFQEYETYDAIGLADLVARRLISPVELLDSALDRIDRRNGAINAVVIDCRDLARRRLQERPPTGPFAGVPFMLKDLHALLKGTATTNGSRFWQSNVADHDSTLVERYEAAGLVILGKTSTAELGLACETAPDLYGPVRNPWRLDRSAGGSSGGAAAAVAAGMLPAAHATDGGGSIRIPASCCGVFGLKPSRARNPYGPDFGEGWNGLAGPHAETISVRDSAALLDVAHGPAPGDPYGIAPPERPFLQEVGAPPGRLRIAFMTTDHGGDPIDPDCAQAVRGTAALCAALGHQVEEARPRIDIEALKTATRVIVGCNTANSLRLRAKALGRPARPGDVEPITWAWAQEGEATSGAAYCGAVTTIHRIGRALGQFLESHDVLLTATFASPPLPLGTVDMMGASLDAYYATLRKHSAFTSLYNATGLPAASLPLHWTADGLPVGVQAAARYGAEAMLLRLCAQLEEARPWRGRRAYAALDATIAAGGSGTGGRP